MRSIYLDSSIPEKLAKEKYSFPEFIMMENAATALEKSVMAFNSDVDFSVFVLCGSGNNGGDGYALARRICGKVKDVVVFAFGEPKTAEAIVQHKMAQAIGVKIIKADSFENQWNFSNSEKNVIVDCIYGTGFHGELNSLVAKFINFCNQQKCFRLACDIPSGIDSNGVINSKKSDREKIAFCAHKTVTMGALKLALFSDEAKNFTGRIETANLGISSAIFEKCAKVDAYLLEEKDIELPLRKDKACHKGNFGHTAIVLGEKPGAGIIAGTAALQSGSGLVTTTDFGLCEQNFMMSPELMSSDNFPEKTSSVLLGSGLGRGTNSEKVAEKSVKFVCTMRRPAIVLDADFFYSEKLAEYLKILSLLEDVQVILTPHPKEFAELLNNAGILDTSVSEAVENRYKYGKKFVEKFPKFTLIAKGANTYIFSEDEVFVCEEGTAALAKAGSGDVLAGICAGLLAQGYSAKDAAITSVFLHGNAGASFEKNWECTPLKLIERLKIQK